MATETKFPVVLIHGKYCTACLTAGRVFGYGRERPLWNKWAPYWPEKELRAMNKNHILVDVGVVSSDHDRACEIFYQLMGGTVDYGEDHSRTCGHKRYGPTYDKLRHPHWSEYNPVHLVGHSFGSTTAIELYQLLCADFFGVGSNAKWVRSIVSIAGPLTGSTMVHTVGMDDSTMRMGTPMHGLLLFFGTWHKLTSWIPPLNRVYDMRMAQWSHVSLRDLLSTNGPVLSSLDMALHGSQPAVRIQRNAQLRHMDEPFLMSIATSPKSVHVPVREVASLFAIFLLAWGKFPKAVSSLFGQGPCLALRSVLAPLLCISLYKRLKKLDIAKMPSMYGLNWLIRYRAKNLPKLFDGFEADHWQHNDGAVNIRSMNRPWFPKPSEIRASGSSSSLRTSPSSLSLQQSTLARCESHISIDAFPDEEDENCSSDGPVPSSFKKGLWYVYRVDSNHLTGTYWDSGAKDLYASLFALINRDFEHDVDNLAKESFNRLLSATAPAAYT